VPDSADKERSEGRLPLVKRLLGLMRLVKNSDVNIVFQPFVDGHIPVSNQVKAVGRRETADYVDRPLVVEVYSIFCPTESKPAGYLHYLQKAEAYEIPHGFLPDR